MNSLSIFAAATLLFSGMTRSLTAGETIILNGREIENCDLVEFSFNGAVFRSGNTNRIHILPWEQLNEAQQNTIREQYHESLINAICRARAVDGTVFHADQDGVIVQITAPKEGDKEKGIKGYDQGAKILKHGIVLISDLPLDIPRSAGDPIKLTAYFKKMHSYDMGLSKLEIEHLTTAKPEWFRVMDWNNADGNKMRAKLRGIKDDKVLFEKPDGTRFVYLLAELAPESQEKAKEVHARLTKFPVP